MSTFTIDRGSKAGFNQYMASDQWANRPDEERFGSSLELKQFLEKEQRQTVDVTRDFKGLQFNVGETGSPMLAQAGDDEDGAYMSNWAFQQFCSLAKLPTDYLRTIQKQDRQLLLDNLNFGMRRVQKEESEYRVLARIGREGEDSVVRAINGKGFGRIMDLDLIDRIIEMEARGWRVPPARPSSKSVRGIRKATEADVLQNRNLGLSVQVGDEIAPAGTYYGDRSSFYIRVNEQQGIEVGGQRLFRMLIIQNSEVGNGYWEAYLAYLVGICGNHILHGVQDLKALKIRHVGAALKKAELAFSSNIVEYAKDTRREDEQLFYRARQKELGVGKVEVVGGLWEKGVAPKRTLEAAWLAAERHESWYGKPNTVWGMVSGLTEVSQESRWQDQRQELDLAAGKLLKMVQ